MALIKTTYDRRSFMKVTAAGSGGFVLGFNWLAACTPGEMIREIPSEWFDVNAYLKVATNGMATIMAPNPEIGQNVKTSMPMVVAEELDIDWKDVIVEQAPLDTDKFIRQVAGGSQSLRHSWKALRTAGATARQMLVNAAAKQWEVDPATCKTRDGVITNAEGETLTYGDVAELAGQMEIPEEVNLKDPNDFTIIGTGQTNVDMEGIITGKPLFGLDLKKENTQIAVVLRPPAFGTKLSGFDDSKTRMVKGVNDVIAFGNKIAVLADDTWAAIKGQRALKARWEEESPLESTEYHNREMLKMLDTPASEPRRLDGNVKKAMAEADQVFERVYEAPYLPHNTMEPMNFYANVTADKVELIGPIQTPERTRRQVAELLGREESTITMDLTRMGGGFGRRLYGNFVLEAAEISSLANTPVHVVYTREDDMTVGIYRPSSKYKFRAAIKNGKLTGYHLVGAGTNVRNVTRENNFPAAAVNNYLVESHNLEGNITIGAWRAPITNFLAFAEQSFLDELSYELKIDPVDFRLSLFEEAKNNPVGEVSYDIDKFVGVIKLAAEKSNWTESREGVHKGFSAYYSHNTYVAEVAEVVMAGGSPKIKRVVCAVDCGIVVNPLGAINQVQGGIIDGIGHAMYGNLTFENGKPQADNFDKYRLIRISEIPKEIEVHFVKSNNDPTGLGEPALPPAGGAIANALFKATGKRFYKQPFVDELKIELG